MTLNAEKYTVITGASSGIGYETAKAFAGRGSNLILIARRKDRIEFLRQEILSSHPRLDIIVKVVDLSVPDNVFQLYEGIKEYPLQTWINNAGFGNYNTVGQQDLNKISQMLHLNVESLTIFFRCLCEISKTWEKHSLSIFPLLVDIRLFLLLLRIVRLNFMSAHLPRG